jgi:hypothetical protein
VGLFYWSDGMIVNIITEFGIVTLLNPKRQTIEDWQELTGCKLNTYFHEAIYHLS